MKLVMTLLVSDEDELVEPNLDYHLAQGVDFVIVTANRASRRVLETVERYVARGVASLIFEDAQTSAVGEWVTRMARLAATDWDADWVLNADADEFYTPETGTLKQVFSAVPNEYSGLTIPMCHFPPFASGPEFFADRMTVREVASLKKPHRFTDHDLQRHGSPKDLCTKVAHRATSDILVSRGGHRVSGIDLRRVPAWRPILGLHFPLRSYDQFERKVIKDGEAVARNEDPKAALSQKKDLYEIYQAGKLPAYYAEKLLDEDKVRTGIADGRLVVDLRLKHFFDGGFDRAIAGTPPGSDDARQVQSLKNEMNRAIYKSRWDPLKVEVDQLKILLDRSQRMLETSTRKLEHAKRRAAEVEQLKLRVAEIERALEANTRELEQAKRRAAEVEQLELRVAEIQRALEANTRELEQAKRGSRESDRHHGTQSTNIDEASA
jgi:hypothetical protein